jgi:hypothetical protein
MVVVAGTLRQPAIREKQMRPQCMKDRDANCHRPLATVRHAPGVTIPLLLLLLGVPACGQAADSADPPLDLMDMAADYCEAEEEVFRSDLYQGTHFDFDWDDATSTEILGRSDVEEFRSVYAVAPVHISYLIMMHRNGSVAIGRGVKLPFGAPLELTAPFQPYREQEPDGQSDRIYQFLVTPGAESCAMSQSILDFVDDYVHFYEFGEHATNWPPGSSYSRTSYRFSLWEHSLNALTDLREIVASSIDQGQCLVAEEYPVGTPIPLATNITERRASAGAVSIMTTHEVSFNDSVYYRAKQARVFWTDPGIGNRGVQCCNATLPGVCSIPGGVPANAISLRQEVEAQYD